MFITSLRIYSSANLMVYFFVVVVAFPEGILIGFAVAFFSLVITLPALLALYYILYLLCEGQARLVTCWITLIISIAFISLIPELSLKLFFPRDEGVAVIRPVSIGCAYAGTLLQSFAIQKFFKSFQHKSLDKNDSY